MNYIKFCILYVYYIELNYDKFNSRIKRTFTNKKQNIYGGLLVNYNKY